MAEIKPFVDEASERRLIDCNAEFRFSGPPLPCLQGLDCSGRVIYAGTMSKILYPSLRLGYPSA